MKKKFWVGPIVNLSISGKRDRIRTFLSGNGPCHGDFGISRAVRNLSLLMRFLRIMGERANGGPPVILRTAKRCRSSIIRCLRSHKCLLVVVGPLVSCGTGDSDLQGMGASTISTCRLYRLFCGRSLRPCGGHKIRLLGLQGLAERRRGVAKMLVRAGLRFRTVLSRIFPRCEKIFNSLCSMMSLLALSRFPSSRSVLRTDIRAVTSGVTRLYGDHSCE